jgi:uncharacterized protein
LESSVQVKNVSKGTIIVSNCKIANSFLTRFMGLMGKHEFPNDEGLLIIPCNSIHMCFMKFPIDVVFLDKTNTVLNTIKSIQPWKFSNFVSKAHCVVELPVGAIENSRTEPGDKLDICYQ